MIAFLALIVLACALAVWIARPLLDRKTVDGSIPDERLDRLIEAKHATLRSILDLDFDFKVGKVSDEDYRHLRRQHEAEAMAILREIDEAASATELTDSLEAEIAAARRRLNEK